MGDFTNEQVQFSSRTCVTKYRSRELSGSVVECLIQDRGFAGLSLTGVTTFCHWARHINPCLVLVQPRKTHPDITEKLLTGMKRIKSNKQANNALPSNGSWWTINSCYMYATEDVLKWISQVFLSQNPKKYTFPDVYEICVQCLSLMSLMPTCLIT